MASQTVRFVRVGALVGVVTALAGSGAHAATPSLTALGKLPGGVYYSTAIGVTADGSVVVGWSETAAAGQAFRWTRDGGMVGMGNLPGDTGSLASGISADGSVIVGLSDSPASNQAFRWTSAGGMVGLGSLPGGVLSFATGVSADGSVVVGSSGNSVGSGVAFRWT